MPVKVCIVSTFVSSIGTTKWHHSSGSGSITYYQQALQETACSVWLLIRVVLLGGGWYRVKKPGPWHLRAFVEYSWCTDWGPPFSCWTKGKSGQPKVCSKMTFYIKLQRAVAVNLSAMCCHGFFFKNCLTTCFSTTLAIWNFKYIIYSLFQLNWIAPKLLYHVWKI